MDVLLTFQSSNDLSVDIKQFLVASVVDLLWTPLGARLIQESELETVCINRLLEKNEAGDKEILGTCFLLGQLSITREGTALIVNRYWPGFLRQFEVFLQDSDMQLSTLLSKIVLHCFLIVNQVSLPLLITHLLKCWWRLCFYPLSFTIRTSIWRRTHLLCTSCRNLCC